MKPKLPILLSASVLLCGCESTLTYKAWHNTEANYLEPARVPELKLFERTNAGAEILVVYHETSERSDKQWTRAFFLRRNESRLENKRRPVCTSPKKAGGLLPIPILFEGLDSSWINIMSNSSQAGKAGGQLYAIVSTNPPSFTLYADRKATATYSLPTYLDRRTTVKRVLLTPLAVTGDAGTAAAILGYYLLAAYIQSGGGGFCFR